MKGSPLLLCATLESCQKIKNALPQIPRVVFPSNLCISRIFKDDFLTISYSDSAKLHEKSLTNHDFSKVTQVLSWCLSRNHNLRKTLRVYLSGYPKKLFSPLRCKRDKKHQLRGRKTGSFLTQPSWSSCIWVNYNISTWIKAIWGYFPLLTMIPVRSQWGRYN